MSKKPKKDNPVSRLAEAPARIRPSHVKNRLVSVTDRAPSAYTNAEWPIQAAYLAGRLVHVSDDQFLNERTRWSAIRDYAAIVNDSEIRSRRDSTMVEMVKSSRSDSNLTQTRIDALKKLVAIDTRLPSKDRTIVRALAERDTSLASAVKLAEGDQYRFTTLARVRTALDALVEAMGKAKDAKYQTADLRRL